MDNDRYGIYSLKGQRIKCRVPPAFGGHKIKGIVKRVFRNVMEDRLELSVGGVLYYFREPDTILVDEEEVVLVYGEMEECPEVEDEVVFANLHATTGGYIDKALRETDAGSVQKIRFHIVG